ncbi:hypothetical protein SAMN05444166_2790 [Singulisphaera sp. GP187]|uniref:hypothetical protein n=1 Tax=Singulisphaera sp. GP187 TaxID=1882752 RepID=UPI000929FEEB|nr:hypothetical protein [Singulisphaera sp. GP187]SIO16665.1 hypothetical protein SAMN05444166_2790 [Singulisphaera sp. GP187]
MKWFLGAALVAVFAVAGGSVRADEQEAKAIIEKAIKAVGGEEKLGNAEAATWKTRGKMTFNDNTNDFNSQVTVQGVDHSRSEFEGEFNGNAIKGVTVLAGDKGWRKFGDNLNELEGNALANQKRTVYLQVIPGNLVLLKAKGFKAESTGEEKVGDKSAAVLKVTAPDGKDFKLFFDKESGLPVKLVATVAGFQGGEFTQETTFDAYKDFGGLKKATKIESKRDGQRFLEQEVTDYKVLDKVDPATFDEPK